MKVCYIKQWKDMKNFRHNKTWKTFYEVIDDEHYKQLDVEFPKNLPLKLKREFNVSHFIPVD